MSRKRTGLFLLALAAALAGVCLAAEPSPRPGGGEPDYAEWNRLLAAYYDPAHGFDYGGIKGRDSAALQKLRAALGTVNVSALDRDQQLAFWINLYNVNTVARVVEGYPVASIRDLSSDPIIRLNVFSKDTVPFGAGKISLNTIENEKVREGFHDPRIHFALNCAAKSCPPLRGEAYVGARVGAQLDDQVRKFMAGAATRVEAKGGDVTLRVTKIFDWFEKDFDRWGGGVVAFVRKYLPPEKARLLPAKGEVDVEHDDYDWALNDWKR